MGRFLMYEDTETWKDSFIILPSLTHLDLKNPKKFKYRPTADTVMQDLEYLADIILIDHDLGEFTADDIIFQIDGDPQYRKTSIILYSGGESVDTLEKIKEKYNCNIICCTKDDLEMTFLNLSKKFD